MEYMQCIHQVLTKRENIIDHSFVRYKFMHTLLPITSLLYLVVIC